MESQLVPYVPRLLLEWQRETPGEPWRAIEGTLVFIDLSGFTAMSEKLAKKGKVGAEEVTEVLGDTFSELLRVAYDVGGGLLKFGGDALLLWFSGAEHAQRGTFAAAEMRRVLRKVGRIKTSGGNVTLRMTVGVHSGEFQFFLLGDSHKEFIVTGPESTQTVAMESAADAGEILLSPSSSSMIDRSFLGEFKDGGCLLSKVPPAPTHDELAALPEVQDVSMFVPTSIRKHLLGGGDEAEHRQVTVAFIKFKGTDALIKKEGTTEAAEQLKLLIKAVQDAVEEFGICFLGTDVDKDGGKVILTAGAPHATEDDDDRMLRALRRILEAHHGLPIQIGVHKGHVFAGSIGPFYRRTYTVMGDAVNTAARVMSRAEPGELLATKAVLDGAETLFEVEELEPFKVKGKAKELIAYRVGKPLGRRQPQVVIDLPLIGRQAELEQLQSMVASAKRGQGSLVELIAHGGLGKSRLLQELTSGLEGVDVLTAQCEQYESATSFFPFKSLLRSVIGVDGQASADEIVGQLENLIDSAAPSLAPWLPLIALTMDVEVPPTPEVEQLDERFQSARLTESVTKLLDAVVVDPYLLIFEDAHWMDDRSRELLAALVKDVGSKPWAVVVTTRAAIPELASAEGAELCLYPLPTTDSAALARLASQDSLLPQQAEVVAQRSGGNPLFVQALVASARGKSELGELPESIESAIAARIDELSPADRTVLRHMAVLGRDIDVSLLSEVLQNGIDVDVQKILKRLDGFVRVHDGRATFRQALIRDAAYEGLSYRKRRAIHEKIGRLIERRTPDPETEAELLAIHFDKAEQFEESWKYSRLAVGRAWKRAAPSNAADFSRKAIRAGKRLEKPSEEMAAVWCDLGIGLNRVGLLEEAYRSFGMARSLGKEIGMVAWTFLAQGICQEQLGKRTFAVGLFTRGLNLIEEGAAPATEPVFAPPPHYREIPPRVWLMQQIANIRRLQGRLQEAVDIGHRALAIAERFDEEGEGLVLSYNMLLLAYTSLRHPNRRKYGELALATAKKLGRPWVVANILSNLAVDAYWEGDWKLALSRYEESAELFKVAGDEIAVARLSNNIAEILSDQGKASEAETRFMDALSIFRAARLARFSAEVTANLGRLAARQGKFEQAEELLSEATEALNEVGYSSLEKRAWFAEALVFQGKADEALELTQAVSGETSPIVKSMLQRVRGLALAQSGCLAEAEECLNGSLQIARQTKSEFEVGQTLRALAATTSDDETRNELFREAQEILDRLGVVRLPEIPLKTKE